MPNTRPLGIQIAYLLKDRGVDVVFGIPGVHNQEMYRGLEEAGIAHILARHEQGAGFMADGYARATGKAGVAFVITGPGLCNIMTPMGQAYSDSIPMLVISSCLDDVVARRGQLHQMKNQLAAAETVCDWSEEAQSAESTYALIDRAMNEFQMNRPRPKHIQVPIKQLKEPASLYAKRDWMNISWEIPAIEMNEVATLLIKSKRPVLVLGGGAIEAVTEVRAFLKICNAAVFTTYAGRGIVDTTYNFLFGSNLARPTSSNVLAKADLVIAVGTELGEVDLWREELGHTARLVRVDVDVSSQNQHSDLFIHCAAKNFFAALAMRVSTNKTQWSSNEVANARRKWRHEVGVEQPEIIKVCDALRTCLPKNTMIYSDMTQLAYSAKEIWDMDMPGHWHHPSGFGTLGYALPAAIGGAISRRGLPTIAIVGDYGFQFTMQELAVAVELELSLPVLLWNNGKLGEIEDSMIRAQIAPNAVTTHNPDFCKLAKAFGAKSTSPKTVTEMQKEVLAAFNKSGPTLIHITPEIKA